MYLRWSYIFLYKAKISTIILNNNSNITFGTPISIGPFSSTMVDFQYITMQSTTNIIGNSLGISLPDLQPWRIKVTYRQSITLEEKVIMTNAIRQAKPISICKKYFSECEFEWDGELGIHRIFMGFNGLQIYKK